MAVDGLGRSMTGVVEAELAMGLTIGQDKVEVYHPQFADSILLFSVGDEQEIANLLKVVNSLKSTRPKVQLRESTRWRIKSKPRK